MKNIKKLKNMKTKEFAKWLNKVSQACFGCDGCFHCAYDKICGENENFCKGEETCEEGIRLWLERDEEK